MKWSLLKKAVDDALREIGSDDAEIDRIDLGIGGIPANDDPEVTIGEDGRLIIQ